MRSSEGPTRSSGPLTRSSEVRQGLREPGEVEERLGRLVGRPEEVFGKPDELVGRSDNLSHGPTDSLEGAIDPAAVPLRA
jgi:hypothetical protein